MAETQKLEREYVIPLRKVWGRMQEYRRAGRAAKAVKKFIAKHMKVPGRDVEKVKLDMYLNNEIWFRGVRHPPAKIKVKAIKEGDIVRVEFVETPEHIKFLKAKHQKIHKKREAKEEAKEEKKETPAQSPEEKKEDEEKKKDEAEKGKAVEESQIKEAKKEKLTEKHAPKIKKTEVHRTSMNRH
jgi:large subunit ribosomal protein L31e